MKQKNDGGNSGGGSNYIVNKSIRTSNLNNLKMQIDVASWVSREPYEAVSTIETKIGRRLLKKYKLKLDSKELKEKIKNYKEIYGVVKKNLPKYIISPRHGYAEPENIKNKEIKDFLTKRYPEQDKKILDLIVNWVVEYEYLR